MEHELLGILKSEVVDQTVVPSGAECCYTQNLRFASGKDRRPMRHRKHADFDPDRANLIWSPAVCAEVLLEDHPAQLRFLDGGKSRLEFGDPFGRPLCLRVGNQFLDNTVSKCLEVRRTIVLAACEKRLAQSGPRRILGHDVDVFFAQLHSRLEARFFVADIALHLIDYPDNRCEFALSKADGFDHGLF